MSSGAATAAIIGWREWIALPTLGVQVIKAKVDTGARSSALHAFAVERFERTGRAMVRFNAHPIQRNDDYIVTAEAALLEERMVRNSGGQEELRPVIETLVQVGGAVWAIELTLTNRDEMGFRMLLGRQAVRRRYLVDPGRSYLQPLPEQINLPISTPKHNPQG
ncbi:MULTISPECIES: ATP-dependent zinc protease family protein [Cyanophyceae]|uniref:ATP-dependent zinc protease n=1 Tax=Leptolyngbya subtilissima DQ-A4 TaxID=2933933 RepID=A0ABV0KBN5_9CYAN|nr:ATP-dependent zinc protease [Nodosilinea sp. FACHB-141]MBD2113700.1 ATP-dependent zinc protease [Nodosilinea sp. FACHB-141]